MRPLPTDYPPYFETYVSLIEEDDIKKALAASLPDLSGFLSSIPEAKGDYAYAENKWTTKQVLQHGIDSEIVFGYRALCIARGEKQSLPSFDENLYAANATVQHRSVQDLGEELLLHRKTTIRMFESFTDKMLQEQGVASNKSITVLSLGYVIAGHWKHHQQILTSRYLT